MPASDQAPPLSLLDGAALFLDFDGTLVDLADTPGAIAVGPHLPDLLVRLQRRLQGRLAIVSGRAVADLERHLDCSGIAVSGSHGAELSLPGVQPVGIAAPAELEALHAEASAFASANGLILEEKPAGLALHYRLAPEAGGRAAEFIAEMAERTGLSVQHGKMVVELRPTGADKGAALAALMREPPFAGARPVFVGDDLTDEDAFAAAVEMGGAGVLVGPSRASEAQWRLAGVAETTRWLEAAARDA
jgi:trehalose 6-phosphate phosphatase